MEEQSLSIALTTRSSADDSDYVLIEQEPWAEDVGRTSKSQGILGVGSMIFGGTIPLPNCGGLAGFDTPVYVYPSRADLSFIFRVSHGEHQAATITTVIREEILNCSLQDQATAEYPIAALHSMRWLGPCTDADGNTVPCPAIVRRGRDFHFSQPVLGSLRLKYGVYRKTYLVRIEEREDSIENNFQCLAYCVWADGGKWREIEAPSGYEETKGNCGNGIYGDSATGLLGNGSAGEICQPEWGQGTYPKAVKADRKTEYEYCSQEIQSDTVTESEESGSEPGEDCSDGPIVTN